MKGLFLIFLLSIICSCNPGNIDCPALESQYSAWLPYKSNDVITYVSSDRKEIKFSVNQYEVSTPKTSKCRGDIFGGSKCPDCPELASSVYAFTQDTTRKVGKIIYNKTYTYINKPKEKNDSVYLSYQIFDHNNTVVISPVFRLNNKDSLLASLTIGNHTYSNVIVHQVDTTVFPSPNPIYNVYFAWKSYYNKEFGVIAFQDLKTRSLFYRKL